MKKITALLGLILSTHLFAHTDMMALTSDLGISTDTNGKCEYSKEDLIDVYLSKRGVQSDKPLVLDKSTNLAPFWQCIFLKQNLNRDMSREDNMPSIHEVFADTLSLPDQEFEVSGRIRYMGTVPKKYRYGVKIENGLATLSVKIHFEGLNPKPITYRLKLAEDNWNKQIQKYSKNYKFRFIIAENKKDSHFSVTLTDNNSRGPYDKTWSTRWGDLDMVHEIGHMMGLDDEYSNLGMTIKRGPSVLLRSLTGINTDESNNKLFKSMKCDLTSIMCYQLNYQAEITQSHYYLVLSRIFQRN